MKILPSFDKILLFSYFIVLSLTGTFFLSLPAASNGAPFKLVDALLVSVSACCVTGLSSVSAESFSLFGLIVLMLLIEFGGMGLISFFALYVAIPRTRISLVNRRLIRSFFIDDADVNPKQIIRRIIITTFFLQGIGALALYIAFLHSGLSHHPFFDAIFHSVSAFCNAGFSTFNSSIAVFTDYPAIPVIICILVITGGIGFTVINDFASSAKHRFKKKLSLHSKIVILITTFLLLAGTFCFFMIEYNDAVRDMTFSQKLIQSFFQAVITRTAGFEMLPQIEFSPVSSLLTIILMFIGGSPGSMAGGIKTTTFFLMATYAFKERVGETSMRIFKTKINAEQIEKAFNIAGKAFLFLCTSILLLGITENSRIEADMFSIFDIMFESVSAFATVGLTRGVTPNLSDWGKIVISITMFIGRTGLFSMMLGLPGSGKPTESMIEYPTGQVMLG